MLLRFLQSFNVPSWHLTETPKSASRTTTAGNLHFVVELLEATIPTPPATELPAQPILLHEHWGPPRTAEAYFNYESRENLVSYQWLEEHISNNSKVILRDGKKILLVWRFLRSRRKFRTTHEVVHIEGVYALIFNHNRPTHSSDVTSPFENELAASQASQSTEQSTALGKWKDRVFPKLQNYLHMWWLPNTRLPTGYQEIHCYEDEIISLGDLVCDDEDRDWVYVTLLDLELDYDENIRSETSRRDDVGVEPYEKKRPQVRTPESGQGPPLRRTNASISGSSLMNIQCPDIKTQYQLSKNDNKFTSGSLEPVESTLTTMREPPIALGDPQDPKDREHQIIWLSEEAERSHYRMPEHWSREPELAFSMASLIDPHSETCKSLRFELEKSKSSQSLRDEQDQDPRGHEARNVPACQEHLTEAYHFNSATSGSSLTYESESQPRDQMRQSITTMTSINDSVGLVPLNTENSALPADGCTIGPLQTGSPSAPPNNQDRQDRSSVVSSSSSTSTDIPYSDDYWTWSAENNRRFHIRTKLDGTEETIWYPSDFAQPHESENEVSQRTESI
ncbi:hypothetical protein K449DRAFT_419847 [Hypoxylon sp. EC38]|nr:hypothetical protein K449DRAFT_419847 [Hypoxylon sp. EC38]